MPKRREGPVLNKATKYYFFDEYVGFAPDKRRIRVSLRTKDPARAQWLWELEYKKQWGAHYGVKSSRPQKITFVQLSKRFIENERDVKKVKEWKTMEGRLNLIAKVWGDVDLRDVSSECFIKLDQFLIKNDRSENTVNHYVALLKTFFNYAIEEGVYHGKNPAKAVKPYVIDKKGRAYSLEEMKRIIEAADRVEKEARGNALIQKHAKRIVLLLLYTGMRLGEVLNLKWENIKEDKIVLRRTETKQRKEKMIPLTEGIQAVLESMRDRRRADGFVIPLRRRRGKIHASHADSVIRKIREYSRIEDFIFHNIRHTASTIMVSEALGQGVGIADVMKVLGHSQIDTTMKYMHSDFGRMKKAVEILGEKAEGNNE